MSVNLSVRPLAFNDWALLLATDSLPPALTTSTNYQQIAHQASYQLFEYKISGKAQLVT